MIIHFQIGKPEKVTDNIGDIELDGKFIPLLEELILPRTYSILGSMRNKSVQYR